MGDNGPMPNLMPSPATERLAPGTALDHLRAIEWDNPNWPDTCPVCESPKALGQHRNDCRLAHAINALAPVDASRELALVG